MNDYPCICSHEFLDHFEIKFYDRGSKYYCRICTNEAKGCIGYKKVDNLKYLESKI